MFTISTTTRLNTNLKIVIVLAITLVAILAFAVASIVVAPKAADLPVTESQNAYVEFLRGEKVLYTNLTELNEALSAYHLGEKAPYKASDVGVALSAYHLGEKMIVSFDIRESALLLYRQGEKSIK